MSGGNGVDFYITRSHLLVVITIIEGGFRSPTVVEKLPDLTYNSPCMLLIRFCGPLGSLCLVCLEVVFILFRSRCGAHHTIFHKLSIH